MLCDVMNINIFITVEALWVIESTNIMEGYIVTGKVMYLNINYLKIIDLINNYIHQAKIIIQIIIKI